VTSGGQLAPVTGPLPDARYLVLASRLIPDRDGGFTISVLRRALDMAAAGARPTLLTIDPGEAADHDAHRAEWRRRGLLAGDAPLHNLFDDARADPSWLRAAALPPPIPEAPWPYRPIVDAAGRTVLELPIVRGDPAWHLASAPVRVWGDDGPIGWLPGYAGLYRAWVNTAAARSEGPVVLICEARQIGEALVAPGEPALDPSVRIVHTTHACHVMAPFAWDSPMDAAWQRWLGIADRFDAVLWLTPGQLRDVEKRVGNGIRSFVVPHPAPQLPETAASPVPGRIVMLNSLIPRKRIDHALHALAVVRATRLEAHLHVYGSGTQLAELEQLAVRLGVEDAVVFHGHTADSARALAEADVFLLASTNEGQGLVVLEAISAGVPVVSYDVPYGPRDSLRHGGGLLVADGDVDALAAALERVIGDRALRDRLSAEGRTAASMMDAAASMRALGSAVRVALDGPIARTQ
jgi:poly(glycerol-phosphate) alpha-glucosyltransferase